MKRSRLARSRPLSPGKPLARSPLARGTSTLQARSPLPQVGPRKKREIATTKKPRAEYLADHPVCEVGYVLWVNQPKGWQGCTATATACHERQKRSALGSLVDLVNLMSSCSYCNTWVEDNPGLAWKHGLTVKSYEDPAKIPVQRMGPSDNV